MTVSESVWVSLGRDEGTVLEGVDELVASRRELEVRRADPPSSSSLHQVVNACGY